MELLWIGLWVVGWLMGEQALKRARQEQRQERSLAILVDDAGKAVKELPSLRGTRKRIVAEELLSRVDPEHLDDAMFRSWQEARRGLSEAPRDIANVVDVVARWKKALGRPARRQWKKWAGAVGAAAAIGATANLLDELLPLEPLGTLVGLPLLVAIYIFPRNLLGMKAAGLGEFALKAAGVIALALVVDFGARGLEASTQGKVELYDYLLPMAYGGEVEVASMACGREEELQECDELDRMRSLGQVEEWAMTDQSVPWIRVLMHESEEPGTVMNVVETWCSDVRLKAATCTQAVWRR